MVYDKAEKMNPYKLQDTFEVMMFSSYEELITLAYQVG